MRWRRRVVAAGHGAIAVVAAFCAPRTCFADSILSPAGPVGAGDRIIMLDAVVIMLAIVIPTMLATLGFAWWFRASNPRAKYLPNWTYSGRLELLVWSIPTLVIFFLGGVIWIGSHQLDPFAPLPSASRPLDIDVVALDWKWLFIYPQQGIASVNRLVVPANVTLRFRITSAAVFNDFFVPRLGSQIYAMNGMTSRLNLMADRPGHYLGLSAQFSGDGFSDMVFDTVAEPQSQFAGWVAGVRARGPALDHAGYLALLRQSRHVSPYTYRSISPGLFDAIAARSLPQGDGPNLGRGGTGVIPGGGS